MRLVNVAFNNLNRRKGRMLLLVFGLTLGVATVVALMGVTDAMQVDIAVRMDEYGANIIVVPKTDHLTLTYGGVTVASAAYDVGKLTLADVEQIGTIKDADKISIVAPKLLGAIEIAERTVLLAGVVFPDELMLKKWWQIAGRRPIFGTNTSASCSSNSNLWTTSPPWRTSSSPWRSRGAPTERRWPAPETL